MPPFLHAHSSRFATALITLGCFTFGFVGTEATHQSTVVRAVAEARAAAVTLEDSRRSLSSSMSRAAYTTTETSLLSAEPYYVMHASNVLTSTMDEATKVATAHDLAIEHTGPVVDAPLRREAAARAALLAAPTEITEQASTNDVARDTLDDPLVAEVLEGETTDPDVVLEVRDRLVIAASEVEEAAAKLDGAVSDLEEQTELARHTQARQALDSTIADVETLVSHAQAMITAVGDKHDDAATPANVAIAADALASVRNGAAATVADETDAETVAELNAELAAGIAHLAAAEDELRSSHDRWRAAENASVAADNTRLRAAYKDAIAQAQADARAAFRSAVRANQGGWSGRPPGVTTGNGRLPASQLCALSYAPNHALQCDAARALERADSAYHRKTGRHLVPNSSYRSLHAQAATRASRGGYAAPAGASNHGWGMAVDLPAHAAAWLRANGASYGWVHPTWARPGGSLPESWHLEFVAPSVRVALPDRPAPVSEVPDALAGL